MGPGSITSFAYYDVGNVDFIGIGSPDIVWVRTVNEHTSVGIRVFDPERHRQYDTEVWLFLVPEDLSKAMVSGNGWTGPLFRSIRRRGPTAHAGGRRPTPVPGAAPRSAGRRS